ncbi:hypothetical protein AgCh_038764 [Apium graveolens]
MVQVPEIDRILLKDNGGADSGTTCAGWATKGTAGEGTLCTQELVKTTDHRMRWLLCDVQTLPIGIDMQYRNPRLGAGITIKVFAVKKMLKCVYMMLLVKPISAPAAMLMNKWPRHITWKEDRKKMIGRVGRVCTAAELGIGVVGIGSNGLVGTRDFLVPTAWFEERICSVFTIIQKFGRENFTAKQDFSPFNVVSWHGNYVPYKYDLAKFCPYNTVLIDHGDPSINTGIFLHSADKFNEDSEHTDITNDKSKTTPLLDENTTAMAEP